ncbi:MAG: LytTR family transcriptional regulator DNA-binding domain-containing protein [Blautia obeum]
MGSNTWKRCHLQILRKSLDEYFVKVHRSYIVNIQHVTSNTVCELVMSNGRVIPVPQKKYAKVREELMRRHI